MSNIQKLQYQVILVLKQPKIDTIKIPWTVSGLEHPSAAVCEHASTGPASCYGTEHIMHAMDLCVGVYILFGLEMAAAAQARSSYLLRYQHKCFHTGLNLSMLIYVSISTSTYNVLYLSRS